MKNLSFRAAFLLVAAVVLGLYYPLIDAPYNSVDDVKMVHSLLNMDQLDMKNLFFPQGTVYYYRPLLGVTFWLDKVLWGLEESFMHLGNVVLHLINSLLLFLFARKVLSRLGSTSPYAPLVATLLFAVHPINTESVNWISGRSDLLAGSFVILTLIFFSKSLWEQKPLWAVVAALMLLLGCMAKETALFLLPGALLLAFLPEESRNASQNGEKTVQLDRVKYVLPLMCAGVGYFLIRSNSLATTDTGISQAVQSLSGNEGVGNSLRILLKVSGFYLKKLFVPWPLNFGIINVSDGYVVLGIVLGILTCFLLWRRSLASMLFIISIVIGSSALLVAMGKMAWTPIAERYLYIPSTTFSVGLVAAWLEWRAKRFRSLSPSIVVAGLVLGVFAVSTAVRNQVWLDNEMLFRDTVSKSPDFMPAQNELAAALLKKGKQEEAFASIRKLRSPAGQGSWDLADINKAKMLLSENNHDEARHLLCKLIENNGCHADEALDLLITSTMEKLATTRDVKETERLRKDLLTFVVRFEQRALHPFDHYRLGQLYLSLGRLCEARSHFLKAYQGANKGDYFHDPARRLSEDLKIRCNAS